MAVPDIDLAEMLAGLTGRFQVPAAQLVVSHRGRTRGAAVGGPLPADGAGAGPVPAFPLGSLTKPFTAMLAMMLAGPTLRTVPVTTHLPLAEVAGNISSALIEARGRTTLRGLQRNFGSRNNNVSKRPDKERPARRPRRPPRGPGGHGRRCP